MSSTLRRSIDASKTSQILAHLAAGDPAFLIDLRRRVSLDEYVQKIASHSTRVEAWDGQDLVGLVALYANDAESRVAFVTHVSVTSSRQRSGLARLLLADALALAAERGMTRVELEVAATNAPARNLYRSLGLVDTHDDGRLIVMGMELEQERENYMMTERDYNAETADTADHRYAYGFDFDVMHPYMIRSFEPFFRTGSALELGSYKGDFTKRLLPYFDDITCVEASDEAVEEARALLPENVAFVESLFETVELDRKYDNVILTHVLEHLDDPVGVLRRVNDEWLAEGGRLLLVCPYANAPSRQIAVKMGLVAHNSAVTPAEAEHGHRRTYALETLEADATAAGLRVVHRSGIFFKALANFQWDRLLNTDIISAEYLDGCYQLGQVYPDLCSSIFLVCERGPVAT